jgi:hypothetical protein
VNGVPGQRDLSKVNSYLLMAHVLGEKVQEKILNDSLLQAQQVKSHLHLLYIAQA